jgi:hypothetical protein
MLVNASFSGLGVFTVETQSIWKRKNKSQCLRKARHAENKLYSLLLRHAVHLKATHQFVVHQAKLRRITARVARSRWMVLLAAINDRSILIFGNSI